MMILFNDNVNYNELLSNIKCNTLFMKANTTIGKDGLIQGALTDEDLEQVIKLISNIKSRIFLIVDTVFIAKNLKNL